ncbi:hypothetical protein [Photobacterium damselae]|uniref:Nitrogen fixation protein NifS n=1 Tax=Photobacterium damselae TaxID=38293 RepID=A0A2T3Q2Q6_PHODM|nr:hypothetical protein [Photobacterium damselae]PSB84878.1 hypothetical protein C5F62_05205 [Photobacterium damselae subsp. damselae]PSB86072.1 hypothetical protein C5F63_13000 [Photobacterium damselae subsp. damselae]PSW77206.1 hypothetical protein CTN07_22030 [Photobacterium damselae]SPY46040.1 Uncharacterised protein [Photobacterium damselae]SUB91753.1 Uncharacterised protein [Photobacterium damselae]
MRKLIVFVFKSSPLLGRGTPFTGAIFSWFKEDFYVEKLNRLLISLNLNWIAKVDDTDSDIYQIEKKANIIICAPGLKYQFFTNKFNKNRILYLTTTEYYNSDMSNIIKLIHEIEKETNKEMSSNSDFICF